MDVEVFARENMQKVLDLLMTDLATVRTGRATSSLIENIIVTVYEGSTSLTIKELATIATADPQTLVLTPFDPSIAGEIQKGILEANVGLNPSCDGQIIRISIPPLSEEQTRSETRAFKINWIMASYSIFKTGKGNFKNFPITK